MDSQIADLAAMYLPGSRTTGRDGLRADCPLCESKRAFTISTTHGGWMCWSCQESGSFTAFLYAVAKLSRKQVDRAVANLRVPPPLGRYASAQKALQQDWGILPEYILGAYDNVPQDLVDKGFDEALLRAHDVGMDHTHRRITFPIRDILGRLAAVAGRATSDFQIPRYKVYDAAPASHSRREGELFGVVSRYIPDNRMHLYGFHSIYPRRFFQGETETGSPLILTEGYKSTLWLRQLKFTDAVGLQGSSLSEMQQRLLSRLRGPYYIMLDFEPGKAFPDRFGRCAALTIAKQLRGLGKVFICLYDPEKPLRTAPDDLLVEEVQTMIATAQTPGQLLAHRR